MWILGPIGFGAPWLLLGLIALPILWILLRAVPPAPIVRAFPGVALLLGLTDDEAQTDTTPWWLMLLRMLAVAAIIIGFAGPMLNPKSGAEMPGSGPLLILADGTWADAGDWRLKSKRIEAALSEAARAGRKVAILRLTDLPSAGEDLPFQAADAWSARLPSVLPQPWEPLSDEIADFAQGLTGSFSTLWVSSGLETPWRADLLGALESHGDVRVFESGRPLLALRPARYLDGKLQITALRARDEAPFEAEIEAHGLDPNGFPQILARATARFEAGERMADVAISLPAELRNRVSRFEISGVKSAGAVALSDDALKRREVALIAGRDNREGLELLSQLHYLRQALEPSSDLIEGALEDVLLANPDVIVLADVAKVSEGTVAPLLAWVKGGGLLLRFAGPRLAGSDVSRDEEDPLMPVRLRAGGRSVGGAMSWGAPKALRVFAQTSPFYGLDVPADVTVAAQVVAQPDPALAERVIAALEDGTPLVTRKREGEGQIVLFHVAANAEWSSLPLSGLFVQMLERLAVSTRPAVLEAEDLAGQVFTPRQVLDGFGRLQDAGNRPGVTGEALATGALSEALLPGLYAGEDRAIALNVIGPDRVIEAMQWPARIVVEGLDVARETLLKPWLLLFAMLLLAGDVIASLALSGRLRNARMAAMIGLTAVMLAPDMAQAQSDDAFAIAATSEVVLAHVITGDAALDKIALAGLTGLSKTIFQRTSIEPAAPISINLETDELAFFPFLYWPISADQPRPSQEAYVKLNRYLRSGGMILFDTRDADSARFGGASAAGKRLQELARPLDIPVLEPIPDDHVLTRTFYLLQDFPGRHLSRDVWVEAAPADATRVEGMPFRNLNDNVTPVVIGGNDWAGAWATLPSGAPMLPVGRGYTGERQRELALRFGVNLVMHVLTGNYKSDQVHVPALLDRLGQ
ncbi:MAG: hypothetical protein ACJA06_000988 [Halocynthiibacter sp.]|jgi:hypothetical protein